jgi:hypothetical protein
VWINRSYCDVCHSATFTLCTTVVLHCTLCCCFVLFSCWPRTCHAWERGANCYYIVKKFSLRNLKFFSTTADGATNRSSCYDAHTRICSVINSVVVTVKLEWPSKACLHRQCFWLCVWRTLMFHCIDVILSHVPSVIFILSFNRGVTERKAVRKHQNEV